MSRILWILLGVLIAAYALPFLVADRTLPPPGVNVRGPARSTAPEQIRLLVDSTAFDPAAGRRVIQQEIFDEVLALVDGAHSLIYTDFFLWNGWQGSIPEDHRALSRELAEALLHKKEAHPEVAILAVADPINRVYGNDEPEFYSRLMSNGIPVVFTDLDRLADSNPLYSKPARFYGRLLLRLEPVARWMTERRAANPFQPQDGPVTPLQIARLLQFKANHRKLVITDTPQGDLRLLVTSFNPADGSSAHSNVGLLLQGAVAEDALAAELNSVEWSALNPSNVLLPDGFSLAELLEDWRSVWSPASADMVDVPGYPTAAWLSEGAIRNRILALLNDSGPGDEIRLALFYLSERSVIEAIKAAAYGGARVRVILDPNRDAFGRVKNGIPNRPAARELLAFARDTGADLQVRWANTHGEQFHTKAMCIVNAQTRRNELLLGSANWTARNLNDRNLEANVHAAGAVEPVAAFVEYFDRAWENHDGLLHTADYSTYAETGPKATLKTLLYRLQEFTGACSF